MRVPFVRLFLSALIAAWAASPAFGQTTLSSGNATFDLNASPTGENDGFAYSNASFRPEGGTTTNHLYAQWLFYRVDGDTRERPFGNYAKTPTGSGSVSMSGSSSGNTMTYSITESAASGTRFTATWTLQLQDGTVPGEATVLHSVSVTNPTASSLTLSLFHFLDFDLNGNTSNSATGDINEMTITDGGMYGSYKPLTAASRYQASTGSPTLDVGLLDESVTSLSNGGLPVSENDWTGAYQWDLMLAAGESRTIQFEMGVSSVPEPGTVLALAAAGLGLVGLARRARLAPRG